MSDKWQVWYCPELNELTVWKHVFYPKVKFAAEHIKSGKRVTMFYMGKL